MGFGMNEISQGEGGSRTTLCFYRDIELLILIVSLLIAYFAYYFKTQRDARLELERRNSKKSVTFAPEIALDNHRPPDDHQVKKPPIEPSIIETRTRSRQPIKQQPSSTSRMPRNPRKNGSPPPRRPRSRISQRRNLSRDLRRELKRDESSLVSGLSPERSIPRPKGRKPSPRARQ